MVCLADGHINPAITLGFWQEGGTSFLHALTYTTGQILGATVGAALLRKHLQLSLTSEVSVCFAGGHINPAISLGFWLAGRISFLRALTYTIGQVLGAAVGAALVRGIDPHAFTAVGGGANKLAPDVNYGQVRHRPVQTAVELALLPM